MEEVLEMSTKELEHYYVLNGVRRRALTQAKAAELLGITDRQVRNLLTLIENKGPQGLVSRKRGRPSNRKKSTAFKQQVFSIVREKYEDFGPSFAREKLAEVHKLNISIETLRKWMTEVHIWIPGQRKIKTHPLRKRRECFGEMIQVDGSHEYWFETQVATQWCQLNEKRLADPPKNVMTLRLSNILSAVGSSRAYLIKRKFSIPRKS